MSTQPEPAQFNATEWTIEQMWSAFDRGELTRESLTEGIGILATAAARAEVARQVREFRPYVAVAVRPQFDAMCAALVEVNHG